MLDDAAGVVRIKCSLTQRQGRDVSQADVGTGKALFETPDCLGREVDSRDANSSSAVVHDVLPAAASALEQPRSRRCVALEQRSQRIHATEADRLVELTIIPGVVPEARRSGMLRFVEHLQHDEPWE